MAPRPLALAALFLLVPAQSQVPPQAVDVLKKVGTKVVETLLKPKMQVESFHLGGFKATQVDPDSDATPEKFSGTATFELPAPLGPRKLTFKGLVLKGSTAEGTLEEALKDFSGAHLGWTFHLSRVVLSDKGSRVEGTATLAGIRVDVAPLTLTPTGLTGTLTPGELLLAEGPFEATLRESELAFSAQGVKLKGALQVTIDPPVRHGITGAPVVLEAGPVTFDSALLAGTGTLPASLATNLPLFHKGQTWIAQTLALGFERGTPVLGGPFRLQFPLNVFCRVGATQQPYLSEALVAHLRGRAPEAPEAPATPARTLGGLRRLKDPKLKLELAWEGITGSLNLGSASLHPSGLTAYRLNLAGGVVRVEKGLLVSEGTQVTGTLAWGPSYTYETSFTKATADLSDGLYVQGRPLPKAAPVGAYEVNASFSGLVCDFSTEHSPEGLPEAWMGIHMPMFVLSLPPELFTFNGAWERLPVRVYAKGGRFEGNGTFSGAVAVNLKKEINLHISPVALKPFELRFVEGSLLEGPTVEGNLNLHAEPLLTNFKPPVQFKLTQNGAEQIEVNTTTPQGPMAIETRLVGVSMVLESAKLNPTNLDLTGRFDFAVEGADLPSVPFDHLVLEGSGAGIDGVPGPLTLDFEGSRWANLPDRLSVNLWGFPFALTESGYGATGDERFYVGFGGDFEVNPLLPVAYNRVLFTTDKADETKGAMELEKLFDIDQSMASLGSLKASLGFHVETAGNQVSDAYFMGTGALKVNMGDTPFGLDAGMRFGRSYQGSSSFPYFYALGHFQTPQGGVPVAPNLEVYGLAGGLAQNFLPDEIRNTTDIQGKPDSSLGLAVMAGVDAGTSDQFTFHGALDLYISQNLTTLLQGNGWLFCGRDKQPEDNQVSADIRFTRNPDTFHATLSADLNLYNGLLRPMGQVELHFGPDQQFVHIGTREAPIRVKVVNSYDASGYMTADFQGGTATFGAGAAFEYRKEADFGIVWGNAYLNARGDLIIEIDADRNPHFMGTLAAEGGAAFGMRFETFWKTYKVTIFSGSIATNLAMQVPGSPTLSGSVTIHYRVLGGLFSGSVNARLDI